MLKYCLFLVAICFLRFSNTVDAQEQALVLDQKNNIPGIYPKQNPKKAGWLSTFIPGAGQIYNRKYLKAALFYVGAAGIAYSIHFNHTLYNDYRSAYVTRINGDTVNLDQYNSLNTNIIGPKYTNEELIILKDFYRRNRDLSWIIATAAYIANILDAIVDAHLMQYAISDDLLVSWSPSIQSHQNHPIPGLYICIELFNKPKVN